MNIHAYTLDSLRQLVRRLQKENAELRLLLKNAKQTKTEASIFENNYEVEPEYDEDQGGRIISRYISADMATAFFTLFWGRQDVYAKRGRNGGYFPQCKNRWNDYICPKQKKQKQICADCEHKCWVKLEQKTVLQHLLGLKEDGSDAIGVYPLFPDGTCRFIVFDFDNHEKGAEQSDYANINNDWQDEVNALRKMCTDNGIEPLIERSRSGKGAHVWILFSKPVKAAAARKFGMLLLDKGALSVNLRTFTYYDRMYPSQDNSDGIGNLIALPMQGQALRNGNTAFVDEYWNAYPDQWDIIYNKAKRISSEDVERFIIKWQDDLSTGAGGLLPSENRPKPWERNLHFEKQDVTGKLHIVLSDGIYVDTLNLSAKIQNQIRALAAFNNPVYYKNKNLGLSNYYNFSSVYMGKDIDGYIKLPRGLRETLIRKCQESSIPYDIEEQRDSGRPIRVGFNGDLRLQQDIAAQSLLSFDDGILSAATAFGKTVVCSYLISQKKVNTLVLVPKRELLQQWVDELTDFLTIDEDPPEYSTKTGRKKIRKNVIGVLSSAKNSLTGIVDVAMIGSVYGKDDVCKLTENYGMVIIDECHHAAAATTIKVLERLKAKYVYGVSATLRRSDKLEPITYMMIGPVRHSFTALDRAKEQGIDHFVYPRYTRAVQTEISRDVFKAYLAISSDKDRSNMIIEDVKDCIAQGRTPLILTRLKEQAKFFYDELQGCADGVFLLYGDNTEKENEAIRKELKNHDRNKSLILIATGQKIGEGFNYPRLDTLMLASPVSDGSLLEQYVGRLNRDYDGKKNVVVYDYIDHHIRVFDHMYNKRLKTYRRIGFDVVTGLNLQKQNANAIYNSENYSGVFERDIVEANSNIIISCSDFMLPKVQRFEELVEGRIDAGITVTVIMEISDNYEYANEIATEMRSKGISVITSEISTERFAVIDDNIVWHGSVNFLGKDDYWDNLIRIESESVAAELKELALVKNENENS